MRPALATIAFTTAAAALRSETSSACAVNAFACGERIHTRRIEVGDMDLRAALLQSDRDRLADALRGAGYERDAAIVADVHVSISSWNVAKESGRRPSSTSWISATSRSIAGVAMPASRAERADDRDLLVDLGLALAHREVAPDARMGLGAVAGVFGKRRDRGARPRLAGAGREGFRIELLEADRRDAARLGDRDHLAPERVEHDEAPRVGEVLRHRVVVQRGREQHRPVGELAPEIAPDVVGQHRVGLEQLEQLVHLARALARSCRRSRRPRRRRGCRTGSAPGRASRRRN